MKLKYRSSNLGCGVIAVAISFYLFFAWLITYWTDRNLDFYFSYFKGHAVDIPFWMSFVLTVLLNGIILVLNIIGELIRFAL